MTIQTTLQGMAAALAAAERELQVPAEQHGVFRMAMIRACVMVQSDAVMRLGSYHGAVGPFPRWQQLAPATQEERARLGYAPNDPLYRDGTLARSIEFTIQGSTGHIGSDLDIAVYQEVGTGRIPPRPFLGPALYVNEFKIHKLFVRAVFKALKLDPHGTDHLDLSGLGAQPMVGMGYY